MATRASYVRIGLFVIVGLLAVLALGIGLGAKGSHRDTVTFYTYFNESVQGLDVGAPVTFRGVRIGWVSGITIAPDKRMVEVRSDIEADAMERLGIWPVGAYKAGRPLPPPRPDIRAQLGSQGFTGVRYVAIDYFDPKTNPPPELSFRPPEHYVPAAKSFSKGLEDSVTKAMDSLTELARVALGVASRVDGVVADLQRGNFGENTSRAVVEARLALRDLDRTLKGVDRAGISDKASAALDAVHTAAGKFGHVLDHVDGEDGLVAATKRSVVSIGDVGRSLTGNTRELEATLTEFREAATAIRLLADELDRQPDALVKGRGAGATP
jgi:paraquat-inducible protein B